MNLLNRFTYSFAWYLALPLVLLYFAKRMLKDAQYKQGFWQRFGYIPEQKDKCIHIHCASLGESKAANPLIKQLISQYPNTAIVVSNTTPAGAEEIKRCFTDKVQQIMAPLDLPHVTRRYAKRLNASLSLFVEVELWPNWLRAMKHHGSHLFLVNGRLSEKSFIKYHNKTTFFAPIFKLFTWLGAQTQQDADYYLQLGASNVHIVGNMKFDLAIDERLKGQALELKQSHYLQRAIWLAASVHPGEYQQVIKAHQNLLTKQSDALLIIAPRHKERFVEIAQYLQSENIAYKTRSSKDKVTNKDSIWLIDSMGELMLFYALSDIAFIGGSLVNIGGHNPLEAAALGRPMLMGPDDSNCADIVTKLSAANALVRVQNEQALTEHLERLFTCEHDYTIASEAALGIMARNKGAVSKTLLAINNELKLLTD